MAQSSGEETGRLGFAPRVALFFAMLFLVYGVQIPYLSLWLDARGLTAAEIGLVSSLPLMARLVATPSLGVLADRGSRHAELTIALLWGGLAVALVLPHVSGFWAILPLWLAFVLATSTVMPLVETVAVAGLKAAGHDYGRMRLWGSLTFILASFAGGAVVERTGPEGVIWMLIGATAATLAAAYLLPRSRSPAAGAQPRAGRALGLADVTALLATPVLAVFFVAVGAAQSAHAALYVLGTLIWRDQGLSPTAIGGLWTIGVLAEVALFSVSGAVVRRVGATELIVLGSVAAVLRWSAMALAPPLWLLVPLQLLHGLTYGAVHLGAIHVIARYVPEAQAGTAQALYSTITAGVGMAGAVMLASWLYGYSGASAYAGMAAIAALGLGAALGLRRLARATPAPLERTD